MLDVRTNVVIHPDLQKKIIALRNTIPAYKSAAVRAIASVVYRTAMRETMKWSGLASSNWRIRSESSKGGAKFVDHSLAGRDGPGFHYAAYKEGERLGGMTSGGRTLKYKTIKTSVGKSDFYKTPIVQVPGGRGFYREGYNSDLTRLADRQATLHSIGQNVAMLKAKTYRMSYEHAIAYSNSKLSAGKVPAKRMTALDVVISINEEELRKRKYWRARSRVGFAEKMARVAGELESYHVVKMLTAHRSTAEKLEKLEARRKSMLADPAWYMNPPFATADFSMESQMTISKKYATKWVAARRRSKRRSG